MLSKAEAMKRARKLPPPRRGVEMKFKPIEVGLAWMELHGLVSAKTPRGNPMWRGELLVVTPPPTPPQISAKSKSADLERGD